jgi:hypothetical protein
VCNGEVEVQIDAIAMRVDPRASALVRMLHAFPGFLL